MDKQCVVEENKDNKSEINEEEHIFVAGHLGMVGSAIVRNLQSTGHKNIVTKTRHELDLTNQQAVADLFNNEKIDSVVLAAAKVGGIYANNQYPAEFIYSNLSIQANVIHQAFQAGITKLLFLGSSCIYPKFAPQPMCEEHLLTGLLEPTNEPYAVAKIAGIKMCEAYNRQYGTEYRSVMPTNLYGPGDNYHLENSHVLPAIIRKYHLAKLAMQGKTEAIQRDEEVFGPIPDDIQEAIGYSSKEGGLNSSSTKAKVVLWGTGKARREFLHVDDMAAACLHVMDLKHDDFVANAPASFLNVGTGKDIMIAEVAEIIKRVVGFEGETIYNTSQPDGTPQKLLDTSKINSTGWEPGFELLDGIQDAYRWYLHQLMASKKARSPAL